MSAADVNWGELRAAGPWIDTHCHLSLDDDHPADPAVDPEADPEVGPEVDPEAEATADEDAARDNNRVAAAIAQECAIIDAARDHAVTRLVTIATDLPSARTGIAIAARHEDVWASVGLHPHDASRGVEGLEALLDQPGVVAVGECGLDYHYEHSPREAQRDAFIAQIALAKAHDLALVIHTREAWDDTFAILDAEGIPERTIIHCFTGGPDEARKCLDRGAFLSFSGIATFKNGADIRAAAALCPADRLLIETDSPFLAPVPFRGKPNRPAWVPLVGATIAAERGVEASEVASTVWANAERVFAFT